MKGNGDDLNDDGVSDIISFPSLPLLFWWFLL